MAYEYMNATLMNSDLTYIFIYANSITNNLFGIFMVIAFFFIVLFGSILAQVRFSGGNIRPELSFLASSFATTGFCLILMQKNGIVHPVFFWVFFVITIISFIWVVKQD